MNWLAKVAAFKLLSALPGGRVLYGTSQKKITRSTIPTADRVGQKIDVGLQYWDWLETNGAMPHANGTPVTHLDFGAGWHPTIPLLFYSLGINRQYLFDVAPLLERDSIGGTVEIFRQIVSHPRWSRHNRLLRMPETDPASAPDWNGYLNRMGMTYHAPFDRSFPDIAGSIDLATCTQVFCYMRRSELRERFLQIHQCLKRGGKFLATIHLKDMFSNCGNGLSPYNYLKFSPFVWDRCINSSIMSYNRFKAPDYRELLEEAGFNLVHWEVEGPTDNDRLELERIPVHRCFKRYSMEELGAKHLFLVAEKTS